MGQHASDKSQMHPDVSSDRVGLPLWLCHPERLLDSPFLGGCSCLSEIKPRKWTSNTCARRAKNQESSAKYGNAL